MFADDGDANRCCGYCYYHRRRRLIHANDVASIVSAVISNAPRLLIDLPDAAVAMMMTAMAAVAVIVVLTVIVAAVDDDVVLV